MRRLGPVWCGLVGLVVGMMMASWAPTWWTQKLRADANEVSLKRWQKGKGWGWVWGPDDEVGALNEMSDASRRAALSLVKSGKVFDLGVRYSRNSFKWPGHSPGEIISFRTPEGVKRQGDVGAFADPTNTVRSAWHSNALFINDNVATQIDGLGHITAGEDNHWYNGFKEADWGSNFGVRKCDGDSMPPIIARGILLDIAAYKGQKVLPSHYVITIEDVKGTCARQEVTPRPGDVVLLRTGTVSLWGADGADHTNIGTHDSAGPDLTTVKYLVEQMGAMMIGSDTSGLEVSPAPKGSPTPVPVHHYLLIEQGIHIGELHNLEELAKEKVYEFCYIATTNRIAGATAGFCLRPLALR